jgi:DNA replication protein DnaC
MTVSPRSDSPAPPQVLLAHHLRQLKLPTFLREYDKIATEAAREGLDHPRYLLRLAELELIDRVRRMVERRIQAAHFPAVKSFDTFDFSANTIAQQAARSRTRALRIIVQRLSTPIFFF